MRDLSDLRAFRDDRPVPPGGARLAIASGRARIRRRRLALAGGGSAATGLAAIALVAAGAPAPRAVFELEQLRPPTPTTSPSYAGPRVTANPTASGGPHAAAEIGGARVGVPPGASPSPSPGPGRTPARTSPPRDGRPHAATAPVVRSHCQGGSASVRGGESWSTFRYVGGSNRDHTFVLQIERPATVLGGPGVLHFPTAQEAEFVVRRGAEVVYHWSAGQVIEAEPHQLPFQPGDCVRWELDWPAIDRQGRPLPAGEYEADYFSTAEEFEGTPSERVRVSVR